MSFEVGINKSFLAANSQFNLQSIKCTLDYPNATIGTQPRHHNSPFMRRLSCGMTLRMALYSAMSPAGVEVAWALT